MKLFEPYEWLLFDLDNTLLDFSNTSRLAFSSALAEVGIEELPDDYAVYQPINGKYWRYFERQKIDADTLRINRFKEYFETINKVADAELMSETYLKHLAGHSVWISGAEKMLKKLSTTHKIAIITNGLSSVQHKRLDKHNIKPYCEHIFISEELGISKPHSGFFEQVHQTIELPNKKNVLVIGDNPNSDIKGGKNFGFRTCWYDYKQDRKTGVGADYKVWDWENFHTINK